MVIKKKKINNIHNRKEKFLEISSTFLYYDVKNENDRIYPKKIAREIIEQFNKRKEEIGNFFGELGYPKTLDINLSNISHEIKEIHLNEKAKTIEGTIKILNTPSGKIVKKMIDPKKDMPFVVRSRGTGNVNEKGEIENFQLYSFDLIDSQTDAFKNINF